MQQSFKQYYNNNNGEKKKKKPANMKRNNISTEKECVPLQKVKSFWFKSKSPADSIFVWRTWQYKYKKKSIYLYFCYTKIPLMIGNEKQNRRHKRK